MDFLSKLNKKISDREREYTTTLYTDLPGFHTLNTDPYVAIKDDVLSAHTCAEIIKLCSKNCKPSYTLSDLTNPIQSNYRTSQDFTLTSQYWPGIQEVKSNISAHILRDPSTMEDPSFIRYLPGEEYSPHYDAGVYDYEDKPYEFSKDMPNVPRVLTLIIYLNDVEQAGETHFPMLDIKVKPKCGRALVFHNTGTNARKPHNMSLHAGLSPKSGKKYILSCWYRLQNYDTICKNLNTDLSMVKQTVQFVKSNPQ